MAGFLAYSRQGGTSQVRHNKSFIRAVICCAIQTHLFPEGQVCAGGTHMHMMVTDALLQSELSVPCAGVAQIKHRNVQHLGQLCALPVFTQSVHVHGCLSTLDQWADLTAAYLPVGSPALVSHVCSIALSPHNVSCAHVDQCISQMPPPLTLCPLC